MNIREYAEKFLAEGGSFPVTFCKKHDIDYLKLCDAVDEIKEEERKEQEVWAQK